MLVDAPGMFDRDFYYGYGNYDYPDNPRRFAVLVRAALEWALRQPHGPDVIHAHDWQAGLAPVYLQSMYALNPTIGHARTVFTIHNLAYQGRFDASWMPRLDLPWSLYNHAAAGVLRQPLLHEGRCRRFGLRHDGEPDLRAGDSDTGRRRGLRRRAACARRSARRHPERHRHRAVGSRNRYLPAAATTEPSICPESARPKAAVLAEYGLPTDDDTMARPLIGMISRMVDQKGFDLIAGCRDSCRHSTPASLSSAPVSRATRTCGGRLRPSIPNQIGARIGFNEGLAHLIEGGADMFLMPSLFEPCGLNQMYSLRYGTVPIVRRVGGLADTVAGLLARPVRRDRVRVRRLLGVGAAGHDSPGDLGVPGQKDAWRALQVNGMAQDLSWDRSAREYVKIYENAISRGRP